MPERLSSQSILPNSLVNWEKLEVQPSLMLKKRNNFPSFFPELGKTEKKFICELGKTWKCSLKLTFKSPNFESMDEL